MKPPTHTDMHVIPNANPALVVLTVWVEENDDTDWIVREVPIVGWHIDLGAFSDDEDAIRVERPVCVGVVDDDWVILDKATGCAWKPIGLDFETRAAAAAYLKDRARIRNGVIRQQCAAAVGER